MGLFFSSILQNEISNFLSDFQWFWLRIGVKVVKYSAPRCSNRGKFKRVFLAALPGALVYFFSVILTIANQPLTMRVRKSSGTTAKVAQLSRLPVSCFKWNCMVRLVSFPISPAYYHQKLLCRLFSTRGLGGRKIQGSAKRRWLWERSLKHVPCKIWTIYRDSEMSINRAFTDFL